MYRLFFTLAFFASAVLAGEVLLKPAPGAQGKPAAFIFLQGAFIDTASYTSLLKEVQAQSPFALWVLAPEFILDLSIPIGLEQAMQSAKQTLLDQGMDPSTPIFYGGHSLGGSTVQGFAVSHEKEVAGIVLMAAPLAREYHGKPFPVPILSLGGQLDAMMRPSRMAESYFHTVSHSPDGEDIATLRTPVVMFPGLTHMSFASGKAPFAVRPKDLIPSVSEEEGHKVIGATIASFMAVHVPDLSASIVQQQSQSLRSLVAKTGEFVKPLLEAMEMEGFYHLRPPCNSDHPSPHCPAYPAWPAQPERTPSTDTGCTCGCPWAMQVAMPTVAGLDPDKYPIHSVDAFHDVTDTKPYHHAHLWNSCLGVTQFPCVMNLTTVSEAMYEKLDKYDTGFTHVSAYEIRTKMKSRQAIYQASIDATAKLADTDKSSFCAAINEKAYKWALAKASPEAAARFQQFGTRMVFGDDTLALLPIGPLWIYNSLSLKEETVDGELVLKVTAPAFKTDVESLATKLYPDSNGYHYCKLLSPFRAMEWIYADGLRDRLGVKNAAPRPRDQDAARVTASNSVVEACAAPPAVSAGGGAALGFAAGVLSVALGLAAHRRMRRKQGATAGYVEQSSFSSP